MTTKRVRLALAAMMLMGIGATSAAAQQTAKPDSYTAEQATAGRAAYMSICAPCHMPDLKGSNEALPLAGLAQHTTSSTAFPRACPRARRARSRSRTCSASLLSFSSLMARQPVVSH
jgi:hypothetical protein